jgi:hypothetical protein
MSPSAMWCLVVGHAWWPLVFRLGSPDGPEVAQCSRCGHLSQSVTAINAAIATEARRAETAQTGSVHEGAGPKDIAQPTGGEQ